MNIRWDFDAVEWWIAGTGLAMGVVFLALAIVAFVAYLRVKQQRDEAQSEVEAARSDLEEARTALEEKSEELEEVRLQLEHANRRLLPRIEIHTAKMSELMEVLKSARRTARDSRS